MAKISHCVFLSDRDPGSSQATERIGGGQCFPKFLVSAVWGSDESTRLCIWVVARLLARIFGFNPEKYKSAADKDARQAHAKCRNYRVRS